MASSSSTQPPAEETTNWLELPRDVTAMILHKLGAIEILTSAQKVCMTWRKICKDPAMWRTIDMHYLGDGDMDYDLEKMTRHAIDRSCGQLVDINIEYFGTDELLQYIIERTSQLRRLRLIYCYNISCDGLSEAAKGLPLLEELHIYFCANISEEAFEAVGRCCPLLKSFSFNDKGVKSKDIEIEFDDKALVIAGNMPELCRLQLFGNRMTNVGLQAILDGCPHLESLDLRQCFNVNLEGDLAKRLHKIKDLRLPHDSTEDYGFDDQIYDEDDPFGSSDVSSFSFDDYGDSYQDNDLDYDSDFDYDDYYTKVPRQWAPGQWRLW
ncbi:putative F-box/LRR-repeat protein 23 [Cornus florida]|uniref:putative F-box/LRR-repeat protein 23 n=1 Tax=Cornus florida TaxID=4283 RepID=UPI002898202E|nr:putative F-box/LRR-repeat protein 23 [Cornus florida]